MSRRHTNYTHTRTIWTYVYLCLYLLVLPPRILVSYFLLFSIMMMMMRIPCSSSSLSARPFLSIYTLSSLVFGRSASVLPAYKNEITEAANIWPHNMRKTGSCYRFLAPYTFFVPLPPSPPLTSYFQPFRVGSVPF